MMRNRFSTIVLALVAVYAGPHGELRAEDLAARIPVVQQANVEASQPESTQAAAPTKRTIKVAGRRAITVTTPQVRLGDVAEITSPQLSDNEAIVGLQKIVVASSPQPGKELALNAHQVVQRMTEEGVNLAQVGYFLPRVISVKRASRAISKDEVMEAIHSYLRSSGEDAQLKDVSYNDDVFVSPGTLTLQARPFLNNNPGRLGFNLKASVDGVEAVAFAVNAAVDSWKEVPVAKRSIYKGSIVGEDDVVMARLNTSAIPGDAAQDPKSIVGLEAHRNITSGEVFHREKLVTPIVVEVGSKVVMRYKTPAFEATATGVALEAGSIGQSIRIRNENSKKVISGTIIEAGLVGVKP